MSKSVPQPQKAPSTPSANIQREEEKKDVASKAQPNIDKQHITPAQIPYLQRTIGNRAVVQLLRNQAGGPIQPKLQVGPVGDKYEQEADRMAAQVMRASAAPVQRHEDEEQAASQVQRSPLAAQVTPLVQRDHGEGLEEEDEELQRAPDATIQRNFPHGAAHSPMPGFKLDDDELASKK